MIPPPLDREIAKLAARQHGVIAARQLAALGVAQRAVSHRVAAGRLHCVHHGVYAVGHRVLTVRGYWMAAVLACGPDAALSHASAAALWEIRYSDSAYTDVIVPRTGRRSRPGLRIHRSRSLAPTEVTTRHGIPVTTAGRTVLVMAARLSPTRLENLLNEVERRELTDYPALDALARAHTGHRRASTLLEEARLIVEADSWAYHKTRRSFESDRARDVLLATAGYRTLRFTDRQLTQTPTRVAYAIHAVLADRRAA